MKHSIIPLLSTPIDPVLNRVELNSLIEDCFKLTTVQVRYQISKIHKPGIMGDLTAKDIAIDAIAPLFTPANDGLIHHLSNSFIDWSPPITNEEQAKFMLVSVLAHRVKQHLHNLMRENDPFFARILDSLNYYIKKEKLIKIEKLKVCYISVENPVLGDFRYLDYTHLSSAPSVLFNAKKLNIKAILDELTGINEEAVAIPLLALARRIKEVNLNIDRPVIYCNETETEYDIDCLTKTAYHKVLEKLQISYVSKGKLSSDEAGMIEKALVEMLSDIKDGGVKPGLFHYFQIFNEDMPHEVYKSRYHNILEYLLKVLKLELSQMLAPKSN